MWGTTKNYSTTDDTVSEYYEKIWQSLCQIQNYVICNPMIYVTIQKQISMKKELENARTLNAANEIFNNIINATVGSPTTD
jgi:hypothetical protein